MIVMSPKKVPDSASCRRAPPPLLLFTSSNSIQSSCAPASRPKTRSVCVPALRFSVTSMPLLGFVPSLTRSSISWLLDGMCHSYWVPLSIWAIKEFWLPDGPLTPAFIWYSPAVGMVTENSTKFEDGSFTAPAPGTSTNCPLLTPASLVMVMPPNKVPDSASWNSAPPPPPPPPPPLPLP